MAIDQHITTEPGAEPTSKPTLFDISERLSGVAHLATAVPLAITGMREDCGSEDDCDAVIELASQVASQLRGVQAAIDTLRTFGRAQA